MENEPLAQVGAGFVVSEATARRYVHETVEVLASWSPGLHEALVGRSEGGFIIIDGTLIPTDRAKTDEPYYSQWHKMHGMTVQVIARPDGTPLWFSQATPEARPTTCPRPARTASSRPVDRLIARRDVQLREKTLWRSLFESCAHSEEVLVVNTEDLYLAGRRCQVKAKGARPKVRRRGAERAD